VPAFRVKLSANDLNCVDVLLNSTHSLTAVSEMTELMLLSSIVIVIEIPLTKSDQQFTKINK